MKPRNLNFYTVPYEILMQWSFDQTLKNTDYSNRRSKSNRFNKLENFEKPKIKSGIQFLVCELIGIE